MSSRQSFAAVRRPTALDVSVQATIVDLIAEFLTRHGTAVVLVSHDLGVVRMIAGRALGMKGGEICEHATTQELFARPTHPYTRELLAAVPRFPRLRCTRAGSSAVDRYNRCFAPHPRPIVFPKGAGHVAPADESTTVATRPANWSRA